MTSYQTGVMRALYGQHVLDKQVLGEHVLGDGPIAVWRVAKPSPVLVCHMCGKVRCAVCVASSATWQGACPQDDACFTIAFATTLMDF